MTRTATLGVGILGSGPVTQAIHLPALARLTHLFTVRAVMDVNDVTAADVAARVGVRGTTSIDEVLQDTAVDVVAVCSPHQFHAEQVIAACRAGKRAVLCEKPFATSTDEALRMAQVSQETGVPIIVGAMHTYDPGWVAFTEAWGPTRGSAAHIRCSAVLPPNSRFEDFAAEVTNQGPRQTSAPSDSIDDRRNRLRGSILGLAIHDLPLIRAFLTSS
jgi:predicted dehydrogenase